MKKTVSIVLAAVLAAAMCLAVFAVRYVGDANGDGAVDNKDVVTLFRYLSGTDIYCDEEVCDLNGDGSADNKDVVLLFRFLSTGQEPKKFSSGETSGTDLQGREIRVLVKNRADADGEIFGEDGGSPVENAAAERFSKAKKAGNFQLSCIIYEKAADDLRKDRKAGLHEFDISVLTAKDLCALAAEDCLADLKRIPQLDLQQQYWDHSAAEAFTVAGKLYCASGDLSVSAMDNAYLLAFNKTALGGYGLQLPYDLVRYGEFTIDQLFDYAYTMYRDVNANGEHDVYDKFGFGSGISSIASLFFGAGAALTEIDGDGSPSLSFSDKTVGVVDKLSGMYGSGVVFSDTDESARGAFTEGRLVFYAATAKELSALMKETKEEYGVVPLPKSDSMQDAYYSTVTQDTLMYAIPYCADGYEAPGCVLELFASLSENLIPAYCSTLGLTGDDAEMLDIILRSKRWDLLYHGLYTEIDEEIVTAYENNNMETFMLTSQFKASRLLTQYENSVRNAS